MSKGSTEQSMAALPRTTLYLDFHQRAPPTQKEGSSPFIELVQKTPSQALSETYLLVDPRSSQDDNYD